MITLRKETCNNLSKSNTNQKLNSRLEMQEIDIYVDHKTKGLIRIPNGLDLHDISKIFKHFSLRLRFNSERVLRKIVINNFDEHMDSPYIFVIEIAKAYCMENRPWC